MIKKLLHFALISHNCYCHFGSYVSMESLSICLSFLPHFSLWLIALCFQTSLPFFLITNSSQ